MLTVLIYVCVCIYIYLVKEIMNTSEILYIAEIRKKHSTGLLVLYSVDHFYCGKEAKPLGLMQATYEAY